MSGERKQVIDRYRAYFTDAVPHDALRSFIDGLTEEPSTDELIALIEADQELCVRARQLVTIERYLRSIPALRDFAGENSGVRPSEAQERLIAAAIRVVLATVQLRGGAQREMAMCAQAIRSAYPRAGEVLNRVYTALAPGEERPIAVEADVANAQGHSADLTQAQWDPSGAPLRIGEYQICGVLGRSRFAVYVARHSRTGLLVAIKLFVSEHTGREDCERLCHHEFMVTRNFRHASIVSVHEHGLAEGPIFPIPYLVMELVEDAHPIDTHASDMRLSTKRRVKLFIQVCSAIEHAHQHNQAHGDLSPANLLVDSKESVRVIDFGFAAQIREFAEDGVRACPPRWHAGTRGFRAPETYGLQAPYVSLHLCDVYALGAILYLLLVGEKPYDTALLDDMELVELISSTPPEFPRRVPKDLRAVIRRAMKPEPNLRYGSVGELKGELRRYLHGLPVNARPLRVREEFMYVFRRHPLVAAVVGLLLILLCVMSIIGVRLGREAIHNGHAGRDFSVLERVMDTHVKTDQSDRAYPSAQFLHWLPKKHAPDGKGRVVVLSYDPRVEANTLVIYDREANVLERLNQPMEVPSEVSQVYTYDPVPLIVGGLVADVIKDQPGDELVVLQKHRRMYPSVMRIYSFDRLDNPLVEVWHLGHWHSVMWNEHQERLVLVAVSNRLASSVNAAATWDQGWSDARASFIFPPVMYTIDPQRLPSASSIPPVISSEQLPTTPIESFFLQEHPDFPDLDDVYGQELNFADQPGVPGGLADVALIYWQRRGDRETKFIARRTLDPEGGWLNAWTSDSIDVRRKGMMLPQRLLQVDPVEMERTLRLIEPVFEEYKDPRLVQEAITQREDLDKHDLDAIHQLTSLRDQSPRWLISTAYGMAMDPSLTSEGYAMACELAERAMERMPDPHRRRESVVNYARCTRVMAMIRGRMAEPDRLRQMLRELLDEQVDPVWTHRLLGFEAMVLLEMGERDLADECVQQMRILAAQTGWNTSEDMRDVALRDEVTRLVRAQD